METQTSDDEFFFLFLKFSVVPKKSTPGKFAHFWHFKRIGTNAEKVWKKREFLFKGLAAVAVFGANSLIRFWVRRDKEKRFGETLKTHLDAG